MKNKSKRNTTKTQERRDVERPLWRKKLLLLLIIPLLGFGQDQCIKGDCENGSGKIIKSFGEYEGEFKDGAFHGEGTLILNAGFKYIGEFKYNLFHGKGTYTWSNGDKYIGDFNNGKKTGKGTYIIEKDGREEGEYIGVYEGYFNDGLADGKGVWTWPDGDKYIGSFAFQYRNGEGTYIWSDGNKYEGNFVYGFPEGEGQLIWNNKTIEGEWTDKRHFLSIDGETIIQIVDGSGLWRLKVK
tara:strand:- start:151 stop:873 length:723 start_codon:yes stop_codon:yes gene_type:complete